MSFEITENFVNQYKSNFMMLSQQKGTRLRGTVMEQPLVGKTAFFEQIGPTSMQERTARHSDTPLISTPHDRRQATQRTFEWADLVDDEDKVRMLADPTSPYAINAAHAAGRQIDDIIIEAASAIAVTGGGHEGAATTNVSFPAAQQVAVNYVESGATANSNLTVGKLRRAAEIFGINDVDEDETRHLVVSQSQITSLLRDDEVTNADYNTVRALVEGKINTYMGFMFHRTQRLTVASSIRTCLAYVSSGIGLAVGRSPRTRISERDDKGYSTQVYVCLDMGASRLEEDKVVEIACDES